MKIFSYMHRIMYLCWYMIAHQCSILLQQPQVDRYSSMHPESVIKGIVSQYKQ